MITFLFIALAAFCKAISDTIRVYDVFIASKLRKYVGHLYIDPEYSWENKYKVGLKGTKYKLLNNIIVYFNWFLSIIVTPFSDLWHTCQTLMIGSFLMGPIMIITQNIMLHWTIYFAWWLCYGVSFEFMYNFLKKDK